MSAAGPGERLRLRLEQFAPAFAEPAANLRRIAHAQADAARDGVELLLTPELSLTGYDLRDLTAALARPLRGEPFPELTAGPDVILGLVERGEGALPFNTAVHLRNGQVLHRHRKLYLPTYGMFDEGRYFARGRQVRSYTVGGWRLGLLICEDLWHPALAYLLALDGVDAILVQTAPAGRGVWEGDEHGGRFANMRAWEQLAGAAATAYGVYVAVANRVGVEHAAVFAGGSFVVAPDGRVLARAEQAREERLTVTLDREALVAARRPFSHLRDEDAHLLQRELAHRLEARAC